MIMQVYEFYDPHPGFAGALVPIPQPVRQVAHELAGQHLPLDEALKRIRAVTDGRVEATGECIGLELPVSDGGRHLFRVIRFKAWSPLERP